MKWEQGGLNGFLLHPAGCFITMLAVIALVIILRLVVG